MLSVGIMNSSGNGSSSSSSCSCSSTNYCSITTTTTTTAVMSTASTALQSRSALQSRVGTEVPKYTQLADFMLARNPDPIIPKDSSHMLPRPNVCPIIGF